MKSKRGEGEREERERERGNGWQIWRNVLLAEKCQPRRKRFAYVWLCSDDILKRAGRMGIFRRCELTACPPPSSSASSSRQIERTTGKGANNLSSPFHDDWGGSLVRRACFLYLDNSFVLVDRGGCCEFRKVNFETRNTNFIIWYREVNKEWND